MGTTPIVSRPSRGSERRTYDHGIRPRTRDATRFELIDGPLPPAADRGVPDARRRLGHRPVLGALGAAVALLVGVLLLPPGYPPPAPPPAPPPVPTTAARTSPCDLAEEGCRIITAAHWRDRTSRIVREHLDPNDRYFTGYGYSVDPLYDSGLELNAIGVDIDRIPGGSTVVFIQIARTWADAVRCGTITQHRCVSQVFMDGNRFSLTPTTTVGEGIEVQHWPTGTYVITLVARNTTAGRPLPVTTGDLISLAEDPRLQPPPG